MVSPKSRNTPLYFGFVPMAAQRLIIECYKPKLFCIRHTDSDIWSYRNTFLLTKFAKSPDTSRLAYILLDGVNLLGDEDFADLINLFQDLGCEKTAIQIMMTVIPDRLKVMNLKQCEIDLPASTKKHNDIQNIIKHRIESMSQHKEFFKDNQEKIIERLSLQSNGKSQNVPV